MGMEYISEALDEIRRIQGADEVLVEITCVHCGELLSRRDAFTGSADMIVMEARYDCREYGYAYYTAQVSGTATIDLEGDVEDWDEYSWEDPEYSDHESEGRDLEQPLCTACEAGLAGHTKLLISGTVNVEEPPWVEFRWSDDYEWQHYDSDVPDEVPEESEVALLRRRITALEAS